VDLSGKIAIVTGGGQGLGRAMAAALAGAGAGVVVVGRNPEKLAEAAKECEALGAEARPAVCDVTDRPRVEGLIVQVAKELGGPHILINNAAVSLPSPIGEMSDELWLNTLGMNISGAFYFCRAAGRHMIPGGGGKVINIGSSAGSRGRPNQVAYAASKAGVIGFTKALAVEWAPHNIQVNCLAPGRFRTPLTEDRIADEEQSEKFLRMVPQQRYGEPSEIQGLALYLSGPQSDFMTGQLIHLDGGSSAL
jgi:2-deoxy-D-gluconate 3-dehydrogenase